MLASVFRRLYFTNKLNYEEELITNNKTSRKVSSKPIEENKESNFKLKMMTKIKNSSRPSSEVQIDYEDNYRSQQSLNFHK